MQIIVQACVGLFYRHCVTVWQQWPH